MTKRLAILGSSLAKKTARLNQLFDTHFADVRAANGQPLNDKRNGHVTLNRWERQNDAIRNAMAEVEKTKEAIEAEKDEIFEFNSHKNSFPNCIIEAIESGELVQWRKRPNRLFVKGVEKARIICEKGELHAAYFKQIPNREQAEKFAKIYNHLKRIVNEQAVKKQ